MNISADSSIIVVNDAMQTGYLYQLTEQPGVNFAPDFQPQLNPEEMLKLGIFGGKYMRDCEEEFPSNWFTHARFASGPQADDSLNYFRVAASMPLSHWRDKGWLSEHDPRGWFQWYCRYYLGRRLEQEDKRQIIRWKAIRRHAAAVVKNCAPGDCNCRRKQRQALLHWAYDSRWL